MAELLRDRDYLPALIREMGRARRLIEARIFLIDPGIPKPSPVEEIFKNIQAARRRGVSVRIETSSIFASKPPGQRLRRLAHRFNVPLHWRGRGEFLHEKSVVIDGKIHLVGSHNWTPSSLLENRELTLRFPTGETRPLDAKAFRRELLEAIRGARKEVTLATYEIEEVSGSDQDFADELVRQLIFLRMKKRKVRVLIDASLIPRAGEGGEDVVLYRGRKKAEELARWGVHVYYDTTQRLFHAKAAVIDGEEIFLGSQNINPVRDGEIEQSVRLSSPPLARKLKAYLADILRGTLRFRYHPLQIPGVRIPLAWVRRGGTIATLFQKRGVKTLSLLLVLLHEAERLKSPEIPWEEERFARLAGILSPRRFTPSVKNRAHYLRRTLTQPRIFLARQYRLLKYDALKKKILLFDEKGQTHKRPEKDFFVLPWAYWRYGWQRRLRSGERYAYLIHLAQVSESPEAPIWSSLPVRRIPRTYAISWQRFSHETVRLERLNLIEVDRDIKIGDPEVPKRANRYRVNSLWSEAEEKAALKKLKEEFMASGRDFSLARRLADTLNQPHDEEVIRKFLVLIERYGPAQVRRATAITARFKPHFALRHVHHTAGILRNWERGIRKPLK